MTLLNWIIEHWFDTLQTVGIISGFIFTGISLRTDARVRRVQNLFSLTKQHREIWMLVYSRPELARVLEINLDLEKHPVTREEELFVKFLIFHLFDSYRSTSARFFKSPEHLNKDIRDFFSLPIPAQVWEIVSPFQDGDFVKFVETSRQVDSRQQS